VIKLLAESSIEIGTGHIVESINIARMAQQHGISVELWVNFETPAELLENLPCHVRIVESFSIDCLHQIIQHLDHQQPTAIITNFRQVTNAQIDILYGDDRQLVCIDEWGNAKINCDAVINPSIVTEYHNYTSSKPGFCLFSGPEYLALSEEYKVLNQQSRQFESNIKQIVVSMGGTDRSGATLRIIDSLFEWRRDVTKHIVIGAGFVLEAELKEKLNYKPDRIVLHQNLPSLAKLLAVCDIGFTAGGNTLYELACVGTPAIVLFEDPHEEKQGRAFEENGFGMCLGPSISTQSSHIYTALNLLESPEKRQAYSRQGQLLVDGGGTERILTSVLALVDFDSSESISH